MCMSSVRWATEMEKQTDIWRHIQSRFKESSEEFSRNQWPRNRVIVYKGVFTLESFFNDPPLGCFDSLFNLLVGMQVRFYTLLLAVPLRFLFTLFLIWLQIMLYLSFTVSISGSCLLLLLSNDSRGESARNGKRFTLHVFTHVFVPLVLLPKLVMHRTAFVK